MSDQWRLSQSDFKQASRTAIKYLAPLGTLYLGSIMPILSTPGYMFNPNDLFPNKIMQGAMVLWIANRLYDLLLRFIADNH